jgi:hypothetical protein
MVTSPDHRGCSPGPTNRIAVPGLRVASAIRRVASDADGKLFTAATLPATEKVAS